jgi:hypothetical protein
VGYNRGKRREKEKNKKSKKNEAEMLRKSELRQKTEIRVGLLLFRAEENFIYRRGYLLNYRNV